MISNSRCVVEIDHRYMDCEFAQTSLKQMDQIDNVIFGFGNKKLMIFLDDVHVSSSKLEVDNLVKDYQYFFDNPSIQIEWCYESEFLSINHPSRMLADQWLRLLGSEVVESFDRGERQQICIKYFDCHYQPKLFPMYHIVDEELIPTCALLSFTWWVHRYVDCVDYVVENINKIVTQSIVTIISDEYTNIEDKVENLVYELYSQKILPKLDIASQWIVKEK